MNPRTEGTQAGADLVDFGNAMRSARTERKISQDDLAAELGTTQSQISNYESGINEPPRDLVFALERILGQPAGALSRYLGYLPVDFDGRKRLTFEEFIMVEEERLDPGQRKTLRDLYRQLTGPETPPRRRRG